MKDNPVVLKHRAIDAMNKDLFTTSGKKKALPKTYSTTEGVEAVRNRDALKEIRSGLSKQEDDIIRSTRNRFKHKREEIDKEIKKHEKIIMAVKV